MKIAMQEDKNKSKWLWRLVCFLCSLRLSLKPEPTLLHEVSTAYASYSVDSNTDSSPFSVGQNSHTGSAVILLPADRDVDDFPPRVSLSKFVSVGRAVSPDL